MGIHAMYDSQGRRPTNMSRTQIYRIDFTDDLGVEDHYYHTGQKGLDLYVERMKQDGMTNIRVEATGSYT